MQNDLREALPGALPVEPSGRRKRKTLSVVQDGNGGGGLFVFVLAGYGDAFAAVELGRGIGARHTLVMLQPPDDDEEFTHVAATEKLAGLYVAKLKEVRPTGPYYLMGYSAGALLALEMAQQLRARNEAVPLLALFDPLILRYTRFERACYGAMKGMVGRSAWLLGGLRYHEILTAMIQDKGLERHLAAIETYEPQPYAGRTILVETRWSRWLRPPTFIPGWRKIATNGLERFRAEGDHHTFLRPPRAARLGRQIVEWTERTVPASPA